MMEITSREELLNALVDASELEHSLACQYVFAALSLKQSIAESITWEQTEQVRNWKGVLLAIAREEMAHLGTVCNLLTAIGGSPHFRLPSFPRPPKYYPLNIPFMLARFSEDALERFVRFEAPEVQIHALTTEVAPEPVEYQRVSELYRMIENAFATLPEAQLFIGPQNDQDDNDWSRNLHISPVNDRKSAVEAVDFIIRQGEGASAHDPNSHYTRFRKMLEELRTSKKMAPDWDPARSIATNPITRHSRDAAANVKCSQIEDPVTLEVAELFNASYETTLLMLQQFYSFGSETDIQREDWRQATREMMSCVIRPVGEVLTQMPLSPISRIGAGAPFEVYGEIEVSPHTANAWTIICERLNDYGERGLKLFAERSLSPRLKLACENLCTISSNLRRSAEGTVRPERTVLIPERASSRYGTSRQQAK
jgi:hypothetical protein